MRAMKNWMQKVSRIVTVALLTLTLSAGFGVAAAETDILTDGQEGLLRHLGVITDTAPEYTHQLTRGELAHIAAKVSNAAAYTGNAIYFYDVEESNPYYQDVYALAAVGVISGDGDGYFRPDDTVSDLEICKIFSVMVGYRDIGQYHDYIRLAKNAEITDGVTMDGIVTYGEALRMAYNTLHTEMYEAYMYGDEKVYKSTENYLAIERYHGLVQQFGIVDGVPFTTLVRPETAIDEGKIRIAGRLYTYADESVFGKSVIFYCQRKGDSIDSTISYLHVNETLTHVMTIQGKDVKSADLEKLTYYVESKEKSVKLDGSPDVIINGVAYPEYKEEDLKPVNGKLTLIDNNNDKKYDVILVEACEYVVIEAVDEGNNIIKGKYPQMIIGSPDREIDLKVTRGRGQLRLNSLKAGDVIKVFRSKNLDGTLKIRINPLEGVTGQAEAFGNNKITIAGTTYYINEGTRTDDDVRIGEMVTVYPDGEIAAAIIHASNQLYKFGYLLDVAEIGSVFSSTLEFRIVDTARAMLELPMGKVLMVDEMKFDDSQAILSRLTAANERRSIATASAIKEMAEEANEKWEYSQPVRYRLNDAGELTHLDTVIYESAYELEDSLRPLNGTESVMQSYSYDHGNMSFYTSYNDENGLVFSLPDTTTAFQVPATERDRVELYRNDQLSGSSVSVEGFTMDEDSRLVKYALVHYNVERDVRVDYNKAWIVSDISSVLDGDGVPVRQVTLVSNANPKTLVLPSDTPILLKDGTTTTELNIGDIVQYDSDLTNAISVINKIMDVSKGIVPLDKRLVDGDSASYDYSILRKDFRVAYGTILAINGSVLTHTTSLKDDLMGIEAKKSLHNYRVLGDTKYFMYEEIGGTPVVNPTTVSQIIPYTANPDSGQKAVMLVRNGSLQAVLVIKEG